LFRGIIESRSASLPPLRKWSFGQGRRQWAGSIGSQPRGAAEAGAAMPSSTAATATKTVPFLPAQRADVEHHERVALVREPLDTRDAIERPAVAATPGVKRGRAQPGADHARLDLGLDVGHLVVPERLVQQHDVARRVRIGITRHVPGVAVRLAAVPEDLDQRVDQRALGLLGIARVQDRGERAELGAAREQDAEVHRWDDQRRAVEVRRHRRQRPAEDASLAGAGVEEPLRVDPAAELGMGVERLRVDHQAPQEHEVEEALLVAIRERRKLRQVA
jgi:hypothetical protein